MTWTPPVVEASIDALPEKVTAPIEKCECTTSESKEGVCQTCSKPKKVFVGGVTCDKGDEMAACNAKDDAPKGWCSICANSICPREEYYACT